ncbi:hypothetical protein HDU84_008574 [Entophlyctis sp. JEL0112]|nr:hypothetical protein HDU84_008574 [Entophlyctis sp. JEL0112]
MSEADTDYKELEVGPDGKFMIPKKSQVNSFKWQEGFVSPFLATSPAALARLVEALYRLARVDSSSYSHRFNSVLDLGSGKGDILFALAEASGPGKLLEGKLRGRLFGVELDGALVNESRQAASSFNRSPGLEFVFVKGDIVTKELFDLSDAGLSADSTVESVAEQVDIITVFLLPAAIAKIIPFLRRMIESGKVVVSVMWNIEYSGQSLEEYRDLNISSDSEIKSDLVKQLQEEVAEKARLIATLENNLALTKDLLKGRDEHIKSLQVSLAFAEDHAKQALSGKIHAAKTNQAGDPGPSGISSSNLTLKVSSEEAIKTQQAAAASALISHRNSKESVNKGGESDDEWGDFGALIPPEPTVPTIPTAMPFDRIDSGVCVDKDATIEPAARMLTNWMQNNGFHSTAKVSDQLSFNQKESICIEVSAEEHDFWKREIANFLAPNTKAHAVFAKALFPVYQDKYALDVLVGKAKDCLREESDTRAMSIQPMMDQIMSAYEGATSLKRIVYQEEEHRDTEWKSYSWQKAKSTLKEIVRDRQDLRERKAKLEREVGDLERHLSQLARETPIVGIDSDPVAAKKEEWDDREWNYFISYRVASDAVLAKELYFRLRIGSNTDSPPTLPNNRVFLDAEKLKDGNNWTEGFATGLKHSKIVILIVSDGCLERMKSANEYQDNVLLEWENAILAAAEGQCAVLPVFVGDVINTLYSMELPAKRFNNVDPNQHKCYLSPRDIISRLKFLQGIFLHDPKSLPTIMKKFPAKLAEIDSCWNDKLHKARVAMSDVGLEGDLLRSVYVHDVASSVQLDAFLEHSLPYFRDKWSQLSFKDCAFGESSSKRLLTKALQSNNSLTSLDISNSELGVCSKSKEASDMKDLIELFSEVSKKPGLLRLAITGNNFGNGSMRSMQSMNWVTHLIMRRNNLNDDDLSAITKSLLANNAIQLLDLSENNIKMEKECVEFKTLLANSESLQEVILRSNHIRLEGAKTIAKGLQENNSLVRLDVYDSDFGPEGAELLAYALEKHQTLEYLNLEKSAIQLAGAWSIRLASRKKESFEFVLDKKDHLAFELPSDNFSQVTHINVSRKLTGDEDNIKLFITCLKNFKNLSDLDLSYCGIDKNLSNSGDIFSGSKYIAQELETFSFLTTLNFSGNYFNPDTIQYFGLFLQNSRITSLHLEGCRIEEDVFEVLASALANTKALLHLNLKRNRIGDGVFELIKLSEKGTSLNVINVSALG